MRNAKWYICFLKINFMWHALQNNKVFSFEILQCQTTISKIKSEVSLFKCITPSRFALHAPLSSSVPSHISTHCLLCVVSSFSERCYETIHLRYYDTGESWGRIHLRNVEQCTCEAGEIKCERVRYTSKICFQLLLFCFNLVLFLLCGPLLLGWWGRNLTSDVFAII